MLRRGSLRRKTGSRGGSFVEAWSCLRGGFGEEVGVCKCECGRDAECDKATSALLPVTLSFSQQATLSVQVHGLLVTLQQLQLHIIQNASGPGLYASGPGLYSLPASETTLCCDEFLLWNGNVVGCARRFNGGPRRPDLRGESSNNVLGVKA
eukprot:2777739-Rhodomonas_salina.1